jgi:hypothetical protein
MNMYIYICEYVYTLVSCEALGSGVRPITIGRFVGREINSTVGHSWRDVVAILNTTEQSCYLGRILITLVLTK